MKKTILSTILGAIALGGALLLTIARNGDPNAEPAAIHSGTRTETGKPAILTSTASAPAENASTAAESLAPTEQRSIREQIEAYEHRFTEELAAVNAANGFGVHYDTAAAELAVAPFGQGEGAWAWRIGLANGKAGRTSTDGDRLTIEHGDGVTGWFVNEPTGVEQGFTLTKPPIDGKLTLACTTDLVPVLEGAPGEDNQAVRFDDPHTGETVLRYTELFVYDAYGKRVPAHMELGESSLSFSPNEISLALNDTGATYPLTVDPTITTLTNVIPEPDDTAASDRFLYGRSVAISGDTLVAGVVDADFGGEGSVYVFERTRGKWELKQRLSPSDPADGQSFAVGNDAIDIENDRIIVGASGDSETSLRSGAIYVFERDAIGTWAQSAKLKGNAQINNFLGSRIAISGERIVGILVSNRVAVFERLNGVWQQSADIARPGEIRQIDVSDDTIVTSEVKASRHLT